MNSSTSFGVEISYFTKLQDEELVEDSRECLPENHRDLLHRRLNRLGTPQKQVAAAVVDELIAGEL